MDYGSYDPASAQDMLTDVVQGQPQSVLPMSRRAYLMKLQQQAADLEGTEPDISQFQQFAAAQKQAGETSMLNALAAQYAGEQFQPVQAQFLKRAMAAQEPMKLGGMMITPDGKVMRDPFAAQERGLNRIDRLIQREQGAITAQEAAELRRQDALDRAAEAQRRRQEDVEWRRERARTGDEFRRIGQGLAAAVAGVGSGNLGRPPAGYRWAVGEDGVPALTFIPGGPADPATKASGAPTEDERKATGWFFQADTARRNMEAAIKSDPTASMAKPTERALGMIPRVGEDIANAMRPEARQRFLQGANAFAEATLRAATGAGVTEAEAIQKVRELTPQLGDKPETIQQKLRSQEMYLESLRVRAGRGLPQGATPAPAAAPTGQADPLGLRKR
jgi:hypothetical protein